jgi:hypothetical protein
MSDKLKKLLGPEDFGIPSASEKIRRVVEGIDRAARDAAAIDKLMRPHRAMLEQDRILRLAAGGAFMEADRAARAAEIARGGLHETYLNPLRQYEEARRHLDAGLSASLRLDQVNEIMRGVSTRERGRITVQATYRAPCYS